MAPSFTDHKERCRPAGQVSAVEEGGAFAGLGSDGAAGKDEEEGVRTACFIDAGSGNGRLKYGSSGGSAWWFGK